MMLRAFCAALLLLSAQLSLDPALAFERSLDAPDIQAAINEGKQSALAQRGYSVAGYVIYARSDTLSIVPGDGSIDAVIVGTPFERVRYASYIAYFQRQTPSAKDIDSAATPNTIEIIVFAHSAGKQDNAFLTHFKNATLTFTNLASVEPTSRSTFGPTIDFFNVQSQGRQSRQDRWLGYVTYTFDLRALKAAANDLDTTRAAFTVTDPQGRQYSVPFVLSHYR